MLAIVYLLALYRKTKLKSILQMLLIHWTKHNYTDDILKNGIRPKTRKFKSYSVKDIKGVWCYPYTRNKNLNHNWKRNLKSWRIIDSNFNGIVFKLEESDFPVYAGSFTSIGAFPEKTLYHTYEAFIEVYGSHFNPVEMHQSVPGHTIDYQDFELILPNRIAPERIIKVIKDRPPLKKPADKKDKDL